MPCLNANPIETIEADSTMIPSHCVVAKAASKATKLTPIAVSGKVSSAKVAADAGVSLSPR